MVCSLDNIFLLIVNTCIYGEYIGATENTISGKLNKKTGFSASVDVFTCVLHIHCSISTNGLCGLSHSLWAHRRINKRPNEFDSDFDEGNVNIRSLCASVLSPICEALSFVDNWMH